MSALLADIGGTNTRCAVTSGDGPVENVQAFENRGFPSAPALLEAYLNSRGTNDRPRHAAIAVAGPVRGETVEMLNIDWTFSCRELQKQLRLDTVELMNDFEAIARALPELDGADLRQIGPGTALPDAPKAVIGPGTGLGVASLVHIDGSGDPGWQPISGEGGHVTLPAADDREAGIIGKVRARFGHCSAERLISGPGLSLLHSTMHQGPEIDAAAISKLADEDDPNAVESLDIFFRMLGTVAANLALTVGAFGGVYIAGGIVPRHADRFAASGFRQRFQSKGRYGDYLKSIPTYLIVAAQPALIGLAAYAGVRFTSNG